MNKGAREQGSKGARGLKGRGGTGELRRSLTEARRHGGRRKTRRKRSTTRSFTEEEEGKKQTTEEEGKIKPPPKLATSLDRLLERAFAAVGVVDDLADAELDAKELRRPLTEARRHGGRRITTEFYGVLTE